jgi:hypothetical protein
MDKAVTSTKELSISASAGAKAEFAGYVLIFGIWLRGFLPGAINFLTDSHYSTEGLTQIDRSQASQMTSTATQVFLILCITYIFTLKSTRRINLFRLLVVFAIVLLNYLPTAVNGLLTMSQALNFVLLLAVALAILRISWSRSHFVFFAYLGLFVIVYSLLLGVFLPQLASFPGLAKNFLGTFLLAGSFGHANTLGLASLLIVGFFSIIPQSSIRIAALSIATVGLVWSGSRTAFLAAILIAFFAVLRQTNLSKRFVTLVTSLIVGFLCVAVPLLTADYEAFTRRGRIWMVSLEEVGHSILLGLGPDWYELQALYATDLGTQASSGHNLFVHVFTTGGVVLVALVLYLFGLTGPKVFQGSFFEKPYSFWMVSFLAISIAEYAFVYSVHSDLFFFTTFPLLLFFLNASKPNDAKYQSEVQTLSS